MELRVFSRLYHSIFRLRGDYRGRHCHGQLRALAGGCLSVLIGDNAAEQISVSSCAGFDLKVRSDCCREFPAVQIFPAGAAVFGHLPLITQTISGCGDMELCVLTCGYCGILRI